MSKQKEFRKNMNSNKKEVIKEPDEMKRLIQLILILVLIFVVFYALTVFLIQRKSNDDILPAEKEVTIQYNRILLTNLLTQKNEHYYVMASSDDDYSSGLYSVYMNQYSDKEDAIRFYTVDLKDHFNVSFLADESNFTITNISELKISKSTLIEIKDGVIVHYYEGKEAIVNQFKEMLK